MNIPVPAEAQFDTLRTDIAAILRKHPKAIVPTITALQDVVADNDPRRQAG